MKNVSNISRILHYFGLLSLDSDDVRSGKSIHERYRKVKTYFQEVRPLRLEPLEERTLLSATWYVTSTEDFTDPYDGMDTLREAIANAADGDTIMFDESLMGEMIMMTEDELLIDKIITIDASALYDTETGTPGITITALGQSRVFNISGGTDTTPVILTGLMITEGALDGNGAGIYNSGSLMIINSTISENSAYGISRICGGGIYNDSGNLTVSNCIISYNSSAGNSSAGEMDGYCYGGGIYNNSGIMKVTDSLIDACTTSGRIALGGGIYNKSGSLTVTGCSIMQNNTIGKGAFGGGIFNETGILTAINCLIVNNHISGGNVAFGGGIYNSSDDMTLTNCTISKNTVYGEMSMGGGIYSGNSGIGDAIVWEYPEDDYSISTLYNTIVVFNETFDLENEVFIENDVYKLFSSTVNAYNSLSSYSQWTSGTGNLVYESSKPLFTDAENGDYTLVTDSQAFNKGDNKYLYENNDINGTQFITTDLNDISRICGDIVDIGAYEYYDLTLEYNQNDYQKLLTFLELVDSDDIKNGTKLNSDYNPGDPTTWSGAIWTGSATKLRASEIKWSGRNFTGNLDVSDCDALVTLECYSNSLVALNVSGCTALVKLYCEYNNFMTLNLSENILLKELGCRNNELVTLDVSNNTMLTKLDCRDCGLETLDLSNNTALTVLYCCYNDLVSLDVSQNTALIQLNCIKNDLTTLDVSKNMDLKDFYCWNSGLNSVYFSQYQINKVGIYLFGSNTTWNFQNFQGMNQGSIMENIDSFYTPTSLPLYAINSDRSQEIAFILHGNDYTVQEGCSIFISAANISGTNLNSDDLTYLWNFTEIENDDHYTDRYGEAFWISTNELGFDVGSHDISLKARTESGTVKYLARVTINIREVSPCLNVESKSYLEGQLLQLNLDVAFYGDQSVQQWTINWGDGTNPVIVNSFSNRMAIVHYYGPIENTVQDNITLYNITLSILDSNGYGGENSYYLSSHTVSGSSAPSDLVTALNTISMEDVSNAAFIDELKIPCNENYDDSQWPEIVISPILISDISDDNLFPAAMRSVEIFNTGRTRDIQFQFIIGPDHSTARPELIKTALLKLIREDEIELLGEISGVLHNGITSLKTSLESEVFASEELEDVLMPYDLSSTIPSTVKPGMKV